MVLQCRKSILTETDYLESLSFKLSCFDSVKALAIKSPSPDSGSMINEKKPITDSNTEW